MNKIQKQIFDYLQKHPRSKFPEICVAVSLWKIAQVGGELEDLIRIGKVKINNPQVPSHLREYSAV